MEVERQNPPAYSAHDPATLDLPSVPRQPLAPAESQSPAVLFDRSLPPALPDVPITTQGSANPFGGYHGHHRSIDSKASLQTLGSAPISEGSSLSPPNGSQFSYSDGRSVQGTSAISIEDPDVRIAAEALSGLGNPDFVRSPSRNPIPSPQILQSTPGSTQTPSTQEEPLLTLISENHPWLGNTINGSLSAYTSTKQYSPRFIQYGANFVENTVGTVGRRTGVEDSIRRYLGASRPSDLERGTHDDTMQDSASKRRRVMEPPIERIDVEHPLQSPSSTHYQSRRASQYSVAESLPAYDDNISPRYEERTPVMTVTRREGDRHPSTRSWSTQLVISTSGLGAALSEKSLSSLKYCLGMLRQATDHVGALMQALRMLLDDYERAQPDDRPQDAKKSSATLLTAEGSSRQQEAERIAANIKKASDGIWQTMKTVCYNVSRYTGGALPENARQLVANQLMSVPRRYRMASERTAASTPNNSETSRTAHRMVAFAREGIDMMSQVSEILANVVLNAERWLESFGRPREDVRASSSSHTEKQPTGTGDATPENTQHG